MIYESDIDFKIESIPPRKEPSGVLLVSPEYFDVVDIKNPYMDPSVSIDKQKAKDQWRKLKAAYEYLVEEDILENVSVIDGKEDLHDMVFAANQSFPWVLENEKVVILSQMKHPARQLEVPYFRKFYENQGYQIFNLSENQVFEGMGDTIPHPGKVLIYGGFGFRTEKESFSSVSKILKTPIVLLQLINPNFYHLDTCFLPISEHVVLIVKEAFNETGLNLINQLFKKVVLISEEEALKTFACNAHCIVTKTNKTAIIQKNADYVIKNLEDFGFQVITVDTSEFMKSGGSVFCLKMMVY